MKTVVLEGPECERLKGWRHFQVVTGSPLRIVSSIGLAARGAELAEVLRAKFYSAGTWELHPANWQCQKCGGFWAMRGMHPDCDGEARDMVQAFPAPLPEILDGLVSQTQPEMAL